MKCADEAKLNRAIDRIFAYGPSRKRPVPEEEKAKAENKKNKRTPKGNLW